MAAEKKELEEKELFEDAVQSAPTQRGSASLAEAVFIHRPHSQLPDRFERHQIPKSSEILTKIIRLPKPISESFTSASCLGCNATPLLWGELPQTTQDVPHRRERKLRNPSSEETELNQKRGPCRGWISVQRASYERYRALNQATRSHTDLLRKPGKDRRTGYP
ncbi:hypothetical protein EYF80_026149 [Liparis tanakae]|uniref:Uncharacterized protein n=1 Tax=Liparis tanakae TaxID=230148 RepID=A0A4Z2HF50_9TELE|nr:hypothetical protein EYF80_026149 [Liparis tanakae]